MKDTNEIIQEVIYELLKINALSTPNNIVELLNNRKKIEKDQNNNIAVQQLGLILDNFEYGKKMGLPICQDTGMINIIIQFSPKFNFSSDLKKKIYEVIAEATKKIPLRPNSVDPFTSKNHGDNLGYDTPPIYFELSDEVDYLKIIVINKGGGSENMSKLFMMNASSALNDVKQKIINLVKKSGGKPCPPIILGIGIGGDATKCMNMAKKALIRPLFSRNSRLQVKNFEEELLIELNKLNIGVMGLGGSTTCLDVRIEWALRHPASFPVGVIVQCYSHRVSSAEIAENGNISYFHE